MEKDNAADLVRAATEGTRRRVSVLAPHWDWIEASLAKGASLNAIRTILGDRCGVSISRQALHQWIKRQKGGKQTGCKPTPCVTDRPLPATRSEQRGGEDMAPVQQLSEEADGGGKLVTGTDPTDKERIEGMVKQIYTFMNIDPLNKE